MTTNTNIQEQLFLVGKQPVFLENNSKPIPGYKAIASSSNSGSETVFYCF